MENSLQFLTKHPCTVVQGVLSNFGAILKFTVKMHYVKNLWEP